MSKHRIPAQRTSSRAPTLSVVPAWRITLQSRWIHQHPWVIPIGIGVVYALLLLLVAM